MKKLFTLALCFIALIASAQNTFETNIYSSSHSLSTRGIIQLKDSNYLVLCYGAHYKDPFVIKLNPQGSIIAQKTLGEQIRSVFGKELNSITAAPDGGFALNTYDGNISDIFVQYDSSLNEKLAMKYSLPQVNYDADPNQFGFSSSGPIWKMPDSGYLLSGSYEGNHTAGGIYIFKIRNDGSYVANSYQIGGTDNTSKINERISTKDGGVVMLCSYNYYPYQNWVLIKTTFPANGDAPSGWAKSINPGFNVITSPAPQYVPTINPKSLFPTSDSGFIFSCKLNGNYTDAVCKVDANGNFVWAKSLEIPSGWTTVDDGITGMVETKDRGYVFSGDYRIPSSVMNDSTVVYLIKLAKDGTLQWNKTLQYHDSVSTTFSNFITTYDGGFAAVGNVGNLNDSISDITVYKFDSAFNTCSPLNTNTNFSIEDVGFTLTSDNGFRSIVDSLDISTTSIAQIATNLHSLNMCSEILPVQLLSFNAILQNKTVNVAWKTTNETNEDHFVVERSSDARTFSDLRTVTAKGNGSANIESYAITDLKPLTGTSYYRLREVDKEGKITYSNIVSLTMLANGIIVISPNPVHDNVHVLLQSKTAEQATFVIADVTGKIVAKQKSQIVEGMNTIHIPAASLSKGLYVLKVIQNNAVQSVKFIKQ